MTEASPTPYHNTERKPRKDAARRPSSARKQPARQSPAEAQGAAYWLALIGPVGGEGARTVLFETDSFEFYRDQMRPVLQQKIDEAARTAGSLILFKDRPVLDDLLAEAAREAETRRRQQPPGDPIQQDGPTSIHPAHQTEPVELPRLSTEQEIETPPRREHVEADEQSGQNE